MKFKVGDKVKHKEFGVGKIVYIKETLEELGENRYAVRFETFNKNLHDLGEWGAPEVKMGHGMWCKECDLELVEEAPQNLLPQIAKMLGVEIGEEFKISNKPDVYKFTKDRLIRINLYGTYDACNTFFELINRQEEIIKLPKKPILTEDEKVILRNLPKEYKWIARDNCGTLYVYKNKPKKDEYTWVRTGGDIWDDYSLNNLILFQHLFQFIKWEDSEAYNIQELLEEDKNQKSE